MKISYLKPVLAVAIMAFGLGMFESAQAQAPTPGAQGTLTVTATVVKSCRFKSGEDTKTMAFGYVDRWATGPVNQGVTFQAHCSIGTTVKAGLDSGQNVSSTIRRMKGVTTATDFLKYTLYSDGGRTSAWPIATGCADTTNLVTPEGVTNPLSTSADFNLKVYGQVLNADAQNVSAQDYSDTVVVYLCAQ